jgi:dUTPase
MPYTLYLVEEKPEISKYPVLSEYDNNNAGVDLITVEDWTGETHLLDLGVKAMLVNKATNAPSHYWLLPRSSIYKTGYMMANSVGVIDASYRGTLKAPVIKMHPDAPGFKAGARHFQIVAPDMGWIQEVQLVTTLPTTERGEGGFGSTG